MKNYQIIIYAGSGNPKFEGSTMKYFREKDCDYNNILKKLSDEKLSASDLRAKTLVIFDDITDIACINLYSALIGFSGRRIEYLYNNELFDGEAVLDSYRKIEDSGKPESIIEEIKVGEGLDVDINKTLAISDITKLRYSKNCILEVNQDSENLFNDFVKISSLRFRNGSEHLAQISTSGDLLDLESLRKNANEIRRSVKNDIRGYVVGKSDVNDRQKYLDDIARTPVELVLIHLDVFHDTENDFWRCPRPDRHRNGDKNPSMKIIDDKIRCYRCDSESIDSLRVIMDTLNISPDDAAIYIENFILHQNNLA